MDNILFVDDDEKILTSAKLYFKNKFNLFFASSGKDALNVLNSNKIDLIVSDYGMSDGDGLFLKREINNTGLSEIPFIVVSGQIEKKASIEFANRHIKYIIEKPVDFEELHEKINEFLKEKKELNQRKNLELIGKNYGQIIHDINNNLGIIMMSSQVGESLSSDKKQQGLFAKNTKACKNINEIVKKYKGIASGEALDLKSITLNEFGKLIESTKHDIALPRTLLQISNEYTAGTASINIDYILLKQVLLNLISNADQALETAQINNRTICVKITNDQSFLYLSVSDNGPGIEEPYKSNLFLEKNSSKGENGTGMGLFYCKKIVENHYGKIYLSKNDESGAEFTIKLPLLGGTTQ